MVGESCDVFAYKYLLYKRLQYHVWKSRYLLIYLSRCIPISTRRQRKNLFGFRVKMPLVTTILTTKGKGNPATYLQLKKTTSELVCLFVSTLFL